VVKKNRLRVSRAPVYIKRLILGALFFLGVLFFLSLAKTFYADIYILAHGHGKVSAIVYSSVAMVVLVCLVTNLLVIFFLKTRVFISSREYRVIAAERDNFFTAVENAPCVVIIMDLKGTIIYANRFFCGAYGLELSAVRGSNVRDIKGARSLNLEFEQIWQAVLTEEKWEGESCRKLNSGDNYWEKITIWPIKDACGSVSNILLMGQDLTSLKAAEREMIAAKNIKSQFTSMISHELRTPLTVIKEIISIVLRGSAGVINEEQRDFLDTAKRNIDRLSRLVTNVLDFQKLDSGKMPFYIQENSINEVIMEIYRSMSLLAEDKGLGFDLELDDKLPRITFDRDKIIQVLTNLVNNAIKFTETGGVKIITSKQGNTVHVIVKDTGVGIPANEISKLFNPFEQLGDHETRPSGGTGLGLVISREIIVKHRGKIWAESEFHKGTSFHFVLPIEERRE